MSIPLPLLETLGDLGFPPPQPRHLWEQLGHSRFLQQFHLSAIGGSSSKCLVALTESTEALQTLPAPSEDLGDLAGYK